MYVNQAMQAAEQMQGQPQGGGQVRMDNTEMNAEQNIAANV
jgi:hypothetical protein